MGKEVEWHIALRFSPQTFKIYQIYTSSLAGSLNKSSSKYEKFIRMKPENYLALEFFWILEDGKIPVTGYVDGPFNIILKTSLNSFGINLANHANNFLNMIKKQ